ncbi:uncharacterized protein [Apostichopus japonicus]|uniref:uncharacterized protein isoform X1 n=1 Tax=Stichopus japonicus TaxID=307972 RepID=UPI003AB86518
MTLTSSLTKRTSNIAGLPELCRSSLPFGSTPENGEEPRPVCIDVPVPPISSGETRQRPFLHRSYSLTTVAMATESVTDVLPLSSSAPAPSLVSLSKKSQEDCAEPSVKPSQTTTHLLPLFQASTQRPLETNFHVIMVEGSLIYHRQSR